MCLWLEPETAVGGVDGVHGDGLGVAGERRPAEAGAPSLVGPPGGAVGAAGAVAAGACGIDRGAGGQRLQDRCLLRRAGDLEVAEQAGREGDGARAGSGHRRQGRGLRHRIGHEDEAIAGFYVRKCVYGHIFGCLGPPV